ncbi:hypothetical protein FCM35_KLT01713 [Carex littledalei]|uniref:Uncharacterized protein n=1 Tax=Carex littledalei TaxID=544730 RepID=A0A833R582_9POAL|nr:hypothetical protein FCM35_KLT01713 [Carex littledalei]
MDPPKSEETPKEETSFAVTDSVLQYLASDEPYSRRCRASSGQNPNHRHRSLQEVWVGFNGGG